MMAFEGKLALVTGAGRGIGLATANVFAEAGASVIIADNNTILVKDVAERLRSAGHEILAVTCDVRDRSRSRQRSIRRSEPMATSMRRLTTPA